MTTQTVPRTTTLDPKESDVLGKAKAHTWEGLSRMAFAANWDPEKAVNWDRPIELGKVREGWINILHYFYEGEWQGLEIIQRLMNKASHLFKVPEMVTYYSTQCADEAKHLLVFRKYLQKLDSPPSRQKAFDPLVFLATSGPMPVQRWIHSAAGKARETSTSGSRRAPPGTGVPSTRAATRVGARGSTRP